MEGAGMIAIGGGYRTLSEIGLALKLGRLVIGLKTWTAATSDGKPADVLNARTAEEAVALAMKEARS
jgi:hypothetical protein